MNLMVIFYVYNSNCILQSLYKIWKEIVICLFIFNYLKCENYLCSDDLKYSGNDLLSLDASYICDPALYIYIFGKCMYSAEFGFYRNEKVNYSSNSGTGYICNKLRLIEICWCQVRRGVWYNSIFILH